MQRWLRIEYRGCQFYLPQYYEIHSKQAACFARLDISFFTRSFIYGAISRTPSKREKQDENQHQKVRDGSPLQKAAAPGHIEIVKLLLDHSADVNIKNNVGNTALIDGSRGGHLGIVRLLLNHDQDVDVKNNAGDTALMDASRRGHVRLVELLKAAGAKD
ncbi:MAG: ankyrin repeat domain-containing protein [Gemmatimonadota bacterium]|nr:ankyrin repeat domain-containing protein [Gemmatimonadota bacterium]